MDPYEILELPRDFTLEQLKEHYKHIALKVHPDKGGSEYLFKLVTTAYKKLLQEFDAKRPDKPFHQLRKECRSHNEMHTSQKQAKQSTTSSSSAFASGSSFNIDRFNQVFDENRIDDETDVGYGTWMAKSMGNREEVSIPNVLGKFTQDGFNKCFDSQSVTTSKRLIRYKEPEPVQISKKDIGYAELGVTKIGDFSGDNMDKKSLHYMDYRLAHTTNMLVDQKSVKQRETFKTIEDVQRDRTNVTYEMTPQEKKQYEKKREKERRHEERRALAQSEKDKLISKQFEKLNKLMLGI